MKPAPAPNVPGNTEAERMSNALRTVLTVSKADLLKKEARVRKIGAPPTLPDLFLTLSYHIT